MWHGRRHHQRTEKMLVVLAGATLRCVLTGTDALDVGLVRASGLMRQKYEFMKYTDHHP